MADLKDKAGCLKLTDELKKRTDRLTVLINNSGATWGAPWDDFPESGWDKLMALNVKSIYYVTVGCHDLLKKGATALNPSRVINIASMAGIQTTDVTTGEDGGLAEPGHGTFSCELIINLALAPRLNQRDRWSFQGSMYPSHQIAGIEDDVRPHHCERYLPWCVPKPDDEFRSWEV